MRVVAIGGSGSGAFEVYLPDLVDGRTRLHADSSDVAAAGVTAAGAGSLSAGGAGAGPLARALTSLTNALGAQGAALVGDVHGAGDTVGANADRYSEDDLGAAGLLGSSFPATDSGLGSGGW